ncbi:hypothetical protein WME75_27765 [Sorangium sp. So ce1014]|uniref:hypothetical protein n=1 Tax=Sorangium sp. So ce1014 TaxID=3133326 RepID=UPI003F5FB818
MKSEINETLLEMHYYRAFVELFEAHFGKKFLRILKPSQRREAFLGFDQGWVRSNVPMARFREELEAAIATRGTSVQSLYLGYFLQYKCPEMIGRRSYAMPPDFQTPYYRFQLSLKPNRETGISQHETLLRLKNVANVDVSYACPMIFDEDSLYESPDLDDVRIVPLDTAPAGYATNESHFCCFRSPTDPAPMWCSQPMLGKSVGYEEWVSSGNLRLLEAREFLDWFERVREVYYGSQKNEWILGKATLPSSLTIVKFSCEASWPTKREALLSRVRR